MGHEKKVFSIRGLVVESSGDKYDKHYVHTDDDLLVYASSLLQWFVGRRVEIQIKEVDGPLGANDSDAL